MNNTEVGAMDINAVVSHILMASWLYYERKISSPWTDKEFDLACLRLLDEWDDADHPHKRLLTKEGLKCQTGFDITYPLIVKHSAMDWYREANE